MNPKQHKSCLHQNLGSLLSVEHMALLTLSLFFFLEFLTCLPISSSLMSLKACLTPLGVPASGGSELSERKLLSTRGLQSGVKCHRHRAQSTQRHRFPWVSPELRVQPPLNPHGVWPHGGHTESAALSETPSWGKRMNF